MHEVAKSTPRAAPFVIIAASRLPEIRDGRKFHVHPTTVVVPSVQHVQRIGRLLFVKELAIHVAHHMIAEIVAHTETVDPAELGKFHKEAIGIDR